MHENGPAPPPVDVLLGWALLARGKRARALRRLLTAVKSPLDVLALPVAEATRLTGEAEADVAPLLDPLAAPGIAEQRRRLAACGARVLALTDPEVPALLREITDAPPVLFIRGRLRPRTPSVALVGSRRASRAGLEAARMLAGDLARSGVAVVSGFARGIDAAAHAAALTAGGTTWAVLGCGVDVCYPSEQAALFGELAARGAILSELPLGTRPEPWHFPVRNRLIAGLSRITIVVEAAEKSGSLITARCAAEGGRDVAAVPGPIVHAGCAGSNALLKDGAILVRSAADVLAELPDEDRALLSVPAPTGGRTEAVKRHLPFPAPTDPDAARCFAPLAAGDPLDADALLLATGLPAPRLSAALVLLELDGLIEALPGAVFAARRQGA